MLRTAAGSDLQTRHPEQGQVQPCQHLKQTGHLRACSHRSLRDLWGRLCPFIFVMMNVSRIQSQDTHIQPAQAPAPRPQGSTRCRLPPSPNAHSGIIFDFKKADATTSVIINSSA